MAMVSSVQNLSLWVLVALLAVFLWELRRLRVARDAVRAANAAKSEFASNISHELRTPLNGIVGAIELLAETNLDAKQCELAAIVRSSSESLLALIDSVLDFARIEAGQVRLERLKFDLRECVGSSVELLRQKADAKGLATEVRIADTVPAFVVGDPVRLRQVLLHLGNNAVKFTESGEVRLEVALAGEASSSNALWFRVVDSGIGIRPEAAARLFDPFTQAESGSARRYGGSGLGLATARRLVQLMEGSMGVESQIGQGSTFWFLLPLEIAAADDLPEPVPSVKGSVLIVDDNPVNRLVTVGAVRRLGYQAEVADSGKGALEACERPPLRCHSARLPDAGDGWLPDGRRHPPPPKRDGPRSDHSHDRQRGGGRPGEMPGLWDGRLSFQANPHGDSRSCAKPLDRAAETCRPGPVPTSGSAGVSIPLRECPHTTKSTQRSFTHSACRAIPSRSNPSRSGTAQLRRLPVPQRISARCNPSSSNK
jgi:nitrogen-specific signal transduction histidine kinase